MPARAGGGVERKVQASTEQNEPAELGHKLSRTARQPSPAFDAEGRRATEDAVAQKTIYRYGSSPCGESANNAAELPARVAECLERISS